MPGLGRKTWSALEVVTAANVQGYLQDQVVQVYAGTAAAGSALGTAVSEGMIRYLSDSNEIHKYTDAGWVQVAPESGNYIANGDFSKWSAGTGVVQLPSVTSVQSMADRWIVGTTDTVTGSGRQSFTPGAAPVAGYESQYFARYVVTTAGLSSSFSQYAQRFNDARLLAGQTVTFSYWAKADAAKSIAIELVQAFGTGGSTAVTTFVAKQALTTSWARYSHTFTVPSVSGKTITSDSRFDLRFWLSAGSDYNARTGTLGNQNITFDVWGVQLEEGSTVSDFKPSGGLKALDTVATGSTGFDGVLVSTISDSIVGSGTPAWAGYDVAGKNKIINGGFEIWQRGTSFSVAASASPTYTTDRWFVQRDGSGATVTVSQQTFTPGSAPTSGYESAYFLRFAQSVAGSGSTYSVLAQRLEDVRSFAGQTVTLSFWAKADTTRSLNAPYLQQVFGSGGSGAVTASGSGISLNTSWQRIVQTINVPSIAGKTIGTGGWFEVGINLPTNTTSTIDIWGVQLEAGTTATSFSRAGGTIQGELAACQRYYVRFGGSANYEMFGFGTGYNTTNAAIQVTLPVTMRAAVSAIDYSALRLDDSNNAYSVTSAALNQTSANRVLVFATVASGLTQFRPYSLTANNSTSAYIGFSAEL